MIYETGDVRILPEAVPHFPSMVFLTANTAQAPGRTASSDRAVSSVGNEG